MSSFRLGVLAGIMIGYVLGARAGRQRYEQIASAARSATHSRPAQQLNTEVREMADRASDVIGAKATEGVSKVTSAVRSAVPGGSGSEADTTPAQPQSPSR